MPTATRAWTAVALLAVTGLFVGSLPSPSYATADEPQTSTLRIRLRGPTMRVRCRAGDCAVSIVGEGNLYHVSITRTQGGLPFTFSKTLANPTNIAVETGWGHDSITLEHVSIPGFLRIVSGAGDDVLDVSDTTTGGKAMIDTGRGNDTVNLEPGTFGGKFRLSSRSGNDDVSLTGGHFEAKSGFDGGQGTDAIHTLAAPSGIPPLIIHFEP